MKLTLPALFICYAVILPACGNHDPGGDAEGVDIVVTDTCMCEELNQENGIYTLDGKPYNGICAKYYPDGKTPFIASAFSKGKLRINTYFDKYGEKTHEEVVSETNISKNPGECECSDLEDKPMSQGKIKTLNGENFTGTCFVYYPDTKNPASKHPYNNGRLQGAVEIIDKSGNTILRQYYDDGEFVRDEIVKN